MSANQFLAAEIAGIESTTDYTGETTAVGLINAFKALINNEGTSEQRNFLHQMSPSCNRSIIVELNAMLVTAAVIDAA